MLSQVKRTPLRSVAEYQSLATLKPEMGHCNCLQSIRGTCYSSHFESTSSAKWNGHTVPNIAQP